MAHLAVWPFLRCADEVGCTFSPCFGSVIADLGPHSVVQLPFKDLVFRACLSAEGTRPAFCRGAEVYFFLAFRASYCQARTRRIREAPPRVPCARGGAPCSAPTGTWKGRKPCCIRCTGSKNKRSWLVNDLTKATRRRLTSGAQPAQFLSQQIQA